MAVARMLCVSSTKPDWFTPGAIYDSEPRGADICICGDNLVSDLNKEDWYEMSQRAELRMKFGGRCAYCGCELSDKWHADHVEAVRRNISNGYAMDRPENDTVSNMVPACIPCNLFKMCSTVEDFRNRIATQVDVTRRASRSYRTAESCGLVQPTNAPVVFWFEKYQAEGANQ